MVVHAGLTAAQFTLFRLVSAAVIAGVVLLVVDRRGFAVGWRQLSQFAILGVTGMALLQFTYARALELLPVGITLLIQHSAVLLVALIAFFFFHEKVKTRLWVSIGCVLLGLAVVAQVWSSDLNPVGVLVAVAAAISLTIYFVGGEHAVGRTSPLVALFWTMSFAAVFWLIFSAWWEIDPQLLARPVPLSGHLESVVVPLWVPLGWNLAFGSFLPFYLSFVSLKHLSATTAGIVGCAEVIFAFLVAWFWLGEELDLAQALGAGVVLFGIVLAQTARVLKADRARSAGEMDELHTVQKKFDQSSAVNLETPEILPKIRG